MGALHLYLLRHVSAPVAELLIGMALLLLAGGLCLIAYRLTRPLPPPKRPAAKGDDASAEALAWVQRHPGQSAVLAACSAFAWARCPRPARR